MKVSLFMLLFIIFSGGVMHAQSMSVTGNWNPNLAASQIAEAGNDYNPAISSATNQTSLSHSLGGGIFNQILNGWQVNVQRVDNNWNPNLQLQLRRTGDGGGTFLSNIAGGTTYQQVSTASTIFYNGNGNFSNIPIQYRLQGISVTLPVGTYSTTIIYTLIDN